MSTAPRLSFSISAKKAERVMIREFNEKFKIRDYMGNEYFEGDLREMLKIFKEFEKIL